MSGAFRRTRRVETIGRQPETLVDAVACSFGWYTARFDGDVLPASAAPLMFWRNRDSQSFHRERTRPAAQLDLDARELTPFRRVVRRRPENRRSSFSASSPDRRRLMELHAGDDFGGGADRGEVVEQLGTGRAHRQAAGKRRREFVHPEQRDVTAHRAAGQIDALAAHCRH